MDLFLLSQHFYKLAKNIDLMWRVPKDLCFTWGPPRPAVLCAHFHMFSGTELQTALTETINPFSGSDSTQMIIYRRASMFVCICTTYFHIVVQIYIFMHTCTTAYTIYTLMNMQCKCSLVPVLLSLPSQIWTQSSPPTRSTCGMIMISDKDFCWVMMMLMMMMVMMMMRMTKTQ